MAEEKKLDPSCIKKGNRPKIEDVINHFLNGDLKEAALNFAAFMRVNKMPFKIVTSTPRRQRADFKGYEICNIGVYDNIDPMTGVIIPPGESSCLAITPNLYNISKYDELAVNEGLNNIPWNVTRYCVFKDNSERTDVNGTCSRCRKVTNRTIFGIEYKGLCHHYWPTFFNPDKETVEIIKRLLALEKQARNG